MNKILHVAIDGNSGSGKTTLARHLSQKYRLFLVDSGTIYNFAVFWLLQQGITAPETVKEQDLDFLNLVRLNGDGTLHINEERYSEGDVCTKNVRDNVSFFAKLPSLRTRINKLILSTIEDMPAVVNGRDIGTVVLPNAQVKVFLEVSIEHRITGWRKMFIEKNGVVDTATLQELIDNACLRDAEDKNRKIAPLACAPDALHLSPDHLTQAEIIEAVDHRVDDCLQSMGSRPTLSICLPTYNRAEILGECLRKLTAISLDSIEFVISDDNSTDNTPEIVKAFSDPRISYYRNVQNGGASYNSHRTFLRARGKYGLLISDEDDLYPEEVKSLVDIFSKEDDIAVYIAGGIRGENDIKSFKSHVFEDGFAALWELGYCTRYMTGVIFQTDLYRETIGPVSFDDAPKIFSVYSFMYAMAKLFFRGKTITSSKMIFRENRFAGTTLTNNAKDTPDIFYFEPQGRKSQLLCSVQSLAQLPITKQQRILMLYKIFYDLVDVTLRAFDRDYLPTYERMIPTYYSVFLSHIEGLTPGQTILELYDLLVRLAEEHHICTIQEFKEAPNNDNKLNTFIQIRQTALNQTLLRIEQ